MQIKITVIFIFLLIVFSCNIKKESMGSNNQINILVSDEDKEYIELYLGNLFNYNVKTPIDENLYSLNFVNSKKYQNIIEHKNIIIASLEDPVDSTGDLLYKKFYQSYKKDLFIINDLYAKNQMILLIGSKDLFDFIDKIDNYNSWILNSFNEHISRNYLSDLKKIDLDENIISIVKNNFGINIIIDENYEIIKNYDNFLWIGRGHPYRWIVLNQIELPENYNYLDTIIDLLENNLTNVIINDKYLDIYQKNNNMIIRGLYEQLDSDTGGPFFTYIFEKYNNNKVIFVSGFVNNPGKNKADLLLQLESIIKNIKGVNYE